MYVVCIDNSGFEDMLTEGSVYQVEQVGENDFKVYDDKEQPRWFGDMKFSLVIEGERKAA